MREVEGESRARKWHVARGAHARRDSLPHLVSWCPLCMSKIGGHDCGWGGGRPLVWMWVWVWVQGLEVEGWVSGFGI